MKKVFNTLLLLLAAVNGIYGAEGTFEVKNPAPGVFQIFYDNDLLIDSVTASVSIATSSISGRPTLTSRT